MSKVKLVLLVPLVLLGWTVLSVLLGVTVGKAIKEHLDPQDPEDLPERQEYQETLDWWESLGPQETRGYQVSLGPLDHQALSDLQARHPQN